ncbi:helix-turn-helix transcriptional regulator [Amycolatopsis rhabdoformis]|uniref:Helix-turn-helix transcriptional regulator n=1 Tax=Amycolatopsis rhabdoformis TaxID=1448059 RepID=A0ABZ1I015_9PSEU|nr:helix-turn-helix transcriptional regulator [Amycolatopsis rhabdoformis]WSE27246.1 helix-turn-helix transcriptional regulator [Amycolatopsis rhabdoformis]
MHDRYSTVRGRQLGVRLRELMEEHHWGVREMARRLDWPPTRISNMFNARRGSKYIDVVKMLTLMGVVGEEADEIYALCEDMDKFGLVESPLDRRRRRLRTLENFEAEASSIFAFQANLIPGFMQTERYCRAQMETAVNLQGDLEGYVNRRMKRRDVLDQSRIKFDIFVHEFVLRLDFGGADLMAEQLYHLLRLAVRPNITIRIVPASAGSHAAVAGSFKLLEFEEADPVVYIDTEAVNLFLEDPEEIAMYRNVCRGLTAQALNEADSKQFITDLVAECYPGTDEDLPLQF